MTRRTFALSAAAAAAAPAIIAQSRRPLNFLWISLEDVCPNFGCYGDPMAITPNTDRLASEGQRYDNAHSVYPVCAPSRSSIITGMYPASIGSHHMRSLAVPPPHVRAFTEYLRAAGYYCSNNVKTDYNFNGAGGKNLSFWDDSSNKAHWRNRDKDQPFFAVFNYTNCHESQIRDLRSEQTKKLVAQLPRLTDPAKVRVPPYYPDNEIVRRDIANYHDVVNATDILVGKTLKELDDDGLRDNTVVFLWGDHGWGMPRGKRWLYDSGTHVPLIVRWPGVIAPGSSTDRLVSLMDLGPTLLSLAGLQPPEHMHGRPFLGQYEAPPRDYLFMARDRMDETYDMIRSVRDKRYRYIRNYQPQKPYVQYIAYMDEMPTMKELRKALKASSLNGPQGEGTPLTEGMKPFLAPEKPLEELYDTQKDPHEIQNLAGDPFHRATLERFRAVHERFMRETGDLGLVPEAELVERMRPGGKWQTTETPALKIEGNLVSATCPTEGASISYTYDGGDDPHWRLYTKPVERKPGLRFRASRIGYRDSADARP